MYVNFNITNKVILYTITSFKKLSIWKMTNYVSQISLMMYSD
jgi:hypothetical protein